jgi:hypothetical protein
VVSAIPIFFHIKVNKYKFYNSEIWYTNIYGFSVSADCFHSNILVNRLFNNFSRKRLIFSTILKEKYLIT